MNFSDFSAIGNAYFSDFSGMPLFHHTKQRNQLSTTASLMLQDFTVCQMQCAHRMQKNPCAPVNLYFITKPSLTLLMNPH